MSSHLRSGEGMVVLTSTPKKKGGSRKRQGPGNSRVLKPHCSNPRPATRHGKGRGAARLFPPQERKHLLLSSSESDYYSSLGEEDVGIDTQPPQTPLVSEPNKHTPQKVTPPTGSRIRCANPSPGVTVPTRTAVSLSQWGLAVRSDEC